jgi:hypothetical protein
MLMHNLTRSAPEWSFARQHFPERDTQRVQIRADVDASSGELLRTRKLGCPGKCPGDEIPASEADSPSVFARPRSIILAVTPPSSFNLTMMLMA